MEPSFVAGRAARLPRKLPIGVRTALTITTSLGLLPFPSFLAAARGRHLPGEEISERALRQKEIATVAIVQDWRLSSPSSFIRKYSFDAL